MFATALNAQRLSDRHLRLSFASGAAMAAVVRDLVAQKNACCSFFELTVFTDVDRVLLDVRVPAAWVDVLDDLVHLAKLDPR